MDNKEEYIQFCQKEENIPLFLQPWWLDAVTIPDGKHWDVLLAKNESNQIQAVLPFVTGKKFGLKFAVMPQLTQYTGVWIKEIQTKNSAHDLSRQHRLQKDLINQLKQLNISFFELKFPLTYKDWLPFYWAGYNQQTCYTYRLQNISDTKKIFNDLFSCKRRKIYKAQEKFHVEYSMATEEFYELRNKQLYAQGKKSILSKRLIYSVINASVQKKQGIISKAIDDKGNILAAIFVVYDKNSAYQIITAIDPKYKYTEASTFVVWETIQKLSKITNSWDFCGSMIEEVECFKRQFGATQMPYFKITKYIKPIAIFKSLIQ